MPRERVLGPWRDRAVCLGRANVAAKMRRRDGSTERVIYNQFFPERSLTLARSAKKICWEECPVRTECLLESIQNGEKHGIWGGLDTTERKAYAKELKKKGIEIEVFEDPEDPEPEDFS